MLIIFVTTLLQCITNGIATTQQCCPAPNAVINRKCLDGSNITILTCKFRHLVGPTLKHPEHITVNAEGNLLISSETEGGVITIEPNMFCMTRDAKNMSDLAYVCYTEDENVSTGVIVMFYIKICCAVITFTLALITLVVYWGVKDLRDLEGKCIINFTAGLCVEHLFVMLLPALQSLSKKACNSVTFIYYTSILFCFIWLSVISFHVWKLTVPIFRKQIKWFVIYCLYGFGVPILILATALTYHNSQKKNFYEIDDCYSLSSIAIWYYFYGPLLLILIMSVLPLIWAAKRLWINIDRRETAQCVVRLRAKCRLFGHLTALMGFVILSDVLMYSYHGTNDIAEYFWDFLDCRNMLVGGAVFLILVAYRNKVLIALNKRGLFGIKFPDRWAKLQDEEREDKDNEEATLTPFSSM